VVPKYFVANDRLTIATRRRVRWSISCLTARPRDGS
jgi:hypothetical protein